MRLFLLCLALCLGFTLLAGAVPDGVAPALPGLHLELIAPHTAYAQGEPIEVTLRYTYVGTETLSVLVVNFDRSGRVPSYGFNAIDEAGKPVRDPFSQPGGMGGGPVNETVVTPGKPFEQQVTVNEWLAFDHPGTYTITAHSGIVHRGDKAFGTPGLELQSQPLQLHITAPDETSRQARLQNDADGGEGAMRDLGFMLDNRAIPMLVRGLESEDNNTRFEAQKGLLALPDLAPVAAEMMRVLRDDMHPLPPRAVRYYENIIGIAATRANTVGSVAGWDELLQRKVLDAVALQPPGPAAVTTVEGMKEGQLPRTSSANWKRVLDNAALMPDASQKDAGELLLHHLTVDPTQDTRIGNNVLLPLHDSLKNAAQNETLAGSLRATAMLALHRIGDDSLRDVVAQELMARQPKLWKVDEWGHPWRAALETLGDYRAGEIAHQLLAYVNTPDLGTTDYYTRRSLVFRLSDFGQSLTVPELRTAYDRVVEATHNSDDLVLPLLESLAIKAPDAAIPLIHDLPHAPAGQAYGLRLDAISKLLSRLDTPAARTLIEALLRSDDERDRLAIIGGLGIEVQEAEEKNPTPQSRLAPLPSAARRYFPLVLQLFQNDPSPNVRAGARYTLSAFSGIPDHGVWREVTPEDARLVPLWEKWWEANRVRFGA